MERKDELPLYHDTYKVLRFIISKQVMDAIPQKHRYDIGSRLKMSCEDMLENILRANMLTNKDTAIRNLRVSYNMVKINLRLLMDEKWISESTYSQILPMMNSIGKQITGWFKYNLKKNGTSERSTDGIGTSSL